MLSDLAAPLLGITSAITWGGGDFCGGLAARRAPLLGVLAVGYTVGVAGVGIGAALTGEPLPGALGLACAVAAGVAGMAGLSALYRGLAVGQMAVVAPISAVLSAAVPVAWGALTDGVPPPAKLLGFAVALLGVFLVARSGPGRADRTGLALALAAGAGFGAFLVLMHTAAEQGPFWPLVLARSTSLTLVLGAALLARRPFAPTAAALPMALASGLLDTAGNTLFVLAGRAGRLDTAAVLSSMYPVSTVLLAAALLRERVRRAQAVGIGLTLLAIVLIAG